MKLEDLSKKFSITQIHPYGDCVIVPGDEFDPDWEAELADQGFVCHELKIDKKPLTIIPLKKMVAANKTFNGMFLHQTISLWCNKLIKLFLYWK